MGMGDGWVLGVVVLVLAVGVGIMDFENGLAKTKLISKEPVKPKMEFTNLAHNL